MKRHILDRTHHIARQPLVLHSWDGEITEPTLLWSPTWSEFHDGKGTHRSVWGLTEDDARAICAVHGVAFKRGTTFPRLSA